MAADRHFDAVAQATGESLVKRKGQALKTIQVYCWTCFAILSLPMVVRSGVEATFDIAEAKGQWAKARALAGSVSGTSRTKSVYVIRPTPAAADLEHSQEVKQNKDCVSLHLTGNAATAYGKMEVIIGANPKYVFQIKRGVGRKHWVLDQIDIGGDGSQLSFAAGIGKGGWAQQSVCEHFQVLNYRLTLERLFDKPQFRATRTGPVTVDGAPMVQIQFECPYTRHGQDWHNCRSS